MGTKKNFSYSTKKEIFFTQKIVVKLSEIWVGDPRSGIEILDL
jgi:hypothetical protein